ncbi:MAG: hypothetical protein H6576_16300 [Lewinellaceae bacterium]|nr:hypothetical protein [Lewinellaceae bacterium]
MSDNERERMLKWCLGIRKQGRLKYSLIHGMLFGFMIFLINALIDLFDMSFFEAFLSKRALFSLAFLLVTLVIAHATFFWWNNERMLKKLLKEEE